MFPLMVDGQRTTAIEQTGASNRLDDVARFVNTGNIARTADYVPPRRADVAPAANGNGSLEITPAVYTSQQNRPEQIQGPAPRIIVADYNWVRSQHLGGRPLQADFMINQNGEIQTRQNQGRKPGDPIVVALDLGNAKANAKQEQAYRDLVHSLSNSIKERYPAAREPGGLRVDIGTRVLNGPPPVKKPERPPQAAPEAPPRQAAAETPQFNRVSNRNSWYINQMRDKEIGSQLFGCGPTSVLMALDDFGVMDATEANRRKLINQRIPSAGNQSTASGEIFPGGPAAIAELARMNGLQAEDRSGVTNVAEVDKVLDQGKGAVINGPNHFVYIAGKDAQGRYVVGDPATGADRWDRATLSDFLVKSPVKGFAAVWNGTPQGRRQIA
jgi:predicted double-glycine peptidase